MRPITTKTGGCLCGAVRFIATGPFAPVVNCHCSQCRRFHGGWGAYTAVPEGELRFDRDDGLTWYESSAGVQRGFCRHCGSSLFWRRQGTDADIAAGALDQPTGLTTVSHIFTADKGDYYEIADGLPQSPGAGATIAAEPNI